MIKMKKIYERESEKLKMGQENERENERGCLLVDDEGVGPCRTPQKIMEGYIFLKKIINKAYLKKRV